MPRKRKPFIDKKKAVKFTVMPRSASDLLASDPTAPRNVLLPLPLLPGNPSAHALPHPGSDSDDEDLDAVDMDSRGRAPGSASAAEAHGEEGDEVDEDSVDQEHYADEEDDYGEEDEVDEEVVRKTLAKELRHGAGDNYDYSQHLRAINEPSACEGAGRAMFSITVSREGRLAATQFAGPTPRVDHRSTTFDKSVAYRDQKVPLKEQVEERLRIDKKSLRQASRSQSRGQSRSGRPEVSTDSAGARLGLSETLFAHRSEEADAEAKFGRQFGRFLHAQAHPEDLDDLDLAVAALDALDTKRPTPKTAASKVEVNLEELAEEGVEVVGGALEEFDGGLADNFIDLANQDDDAFDEEDEEYDEEFDEEDGEFDDEGPAVLVRKIPTLPPPKASKPAPQAQKPRTSTLDDIDGDQGNEEGEESDEEGSEGSEGLASAGLVSQIKREHQKEVQRAFEKELAAFDEAQATLEDDEDPALLDGTMDISEFEGVMDEFLAQGPTKGRTASKVPVLSAPPLGPREIAAKFTQDDDESSETEEEDGGEEAEGSESSDSGEFLYVTTRQPDEKKWDCESIISTLTNTDNHPKLIQDPPRSLKPIQLRLNKRGVPLAGLPKVEKPSEASEESDEASDEAPAAPIPARTKEETKDQKKLRKSAVKAARKEGRQRKKELKVAYKAEEHRQTKAATKQAQAGGANGLSIFNY